MPLTLPNPTFTAGTVISPTEVNANNTAIVSKFAGGIVNADISASAGIAVTKLDASYEHMDVVLNVYSASLITAVPALASWPGGNQIVAAVPVPGVNGDTAWVATAATWCCTDTGGGTGTFDVLWGYFTGNPGAFNTSTALFAAAVTIANSGAANDSNDGTCGLTGGAPVTLAYTANSPHHLVLRGTGADATTLNAQYGLLSVTVRLRRAISAS